MKKAAVSEYGYINAKLRSKISLILTEEFSRALTGASNIEEAVQFLENSGFKSAADVWNRTGDIQNVEFELFCRHIENYRMVMKHTDGDLHGFVNILSMKPEIENIKTALRLWYGSRISKRPVGYRSSYLYKKRIFEKIDWNAFINSITYEEISSVFQNTIYSPVFNSHSVFDSKDSIFDIEIALDRLYYSHLNEQQTILNSADRKILQKIISTEIDLQNISWLIRYRHFYKMKINDLKKVLIPGGNGIDLDKIKNTAFESEDNISPLELMKKSYPELAAVNISDKHNFSAQAVMFEQLLDETRKRIFNSILSGYPFTIGIILVYFFMSEREFRFISSVLNGKNYDYSPERIEELSR